jgi:hypothetical protein
MVAFELSQVKLQQTDSNQIKDEQLDQSELDQAASQHPPGLGHLFAGHSNLKRKKRFIGNLLQVT